jgi:FkbM family methyltransferase
MPVDAVSVAAATAVRAAVIHLPPRRRGMRLVDLVESVFGTPTQRLRSRHVSGYHITCDLTDAVQRSLFYRGTYEPAASELVKRALGRGDTFLDAGANVGHYTFLAARAVGPNGCVHAIEASPSTARALADDVRWNVLTKTVSVHNVAAFDRSARLSLYVGEGPSPIGMRSLHQPRGSQAVEEVDALPLDELLPEVQPAVIKVDVEGADLRALSGMARMIERSRPRLIVVEADDEQLRQFGDSTQELKTFLQRFGYSWEPIHEPFHPPSLSFVRH